MHKRHLAIFSPTVTLSCGGSSSENNSYIVQGSTTSAPASPCTYSVCPCSTDICRIRYDFTTNVLATQSSISTSSTAGTGTYLTASMVIYRASQHVWNRLNLMFWRSEVCKQSKKHFPKMYFTLKNCLLCHFCELQKYFFPIILFINWFSKLLGHHVGSPYHFCTYRHCFDTQSCFPDYAAGACLTDQMSITSPGGIGSPIICGYNSGQHSKFLLLCQSAIFW